MVATAVAAKVASAAPTVQARVAVAATAVAVVATAVAGGAAVPSNVYYDLQGRQLHQPVQHGVYINGNGEKVIR